MKKSLKIFKVFDIFNYNSKKINKNIKNYECNKILR